MKKKRRGLLAGFIGWLISLFILIAIVGAVVWIHLESQLPDVEALKDVQLQEPLRIYSKEGDLIGEFGEMRRQPLTLDQIPKPLIAAVLATEDQRYFEHGGIDPLGLLRAAIDLALTGKISQGASTITMQVARNFYLSREKTFMRKINEILLAMKIDRELTKEKILELYLNVIYLGKRAYGVGAASQVYYGKPLEELTIAEMAMIAGLPKAPSMLNPIANPERAKSRRNHVLERMYSMKYISAEVYNQALATPLTAKYHGQPIKVQAPYVAEMARHLMVKGFTEEAYSKGYHVYTTIETKLQDAANTAANDALLAYDQRHGYRGPEAHLGKFDRNKIAAWQHKLATEMHTVGGLVPAAIIALAPSQATALLSDGTMVSIQSAQLAWGRAKIRVGDVVRLQQINVAAPETPAPAPKTDPKTGTAVRTPASITPIPPARTLWKLSQVPRAQAALVALNPQDGSIKALVGGFDYRVSSFNRVLQAQRQPGSNFKPFIYAAALSKGYTLASLINDAPIAIYDPGSRTIWRPQNNSRTFRGPTRILVGLTFSINTISVRLLQAIGVPYGIEYLHHFGFDEARMPKNFTLALGTPEITPLELATGYAVFANGGYQVSPYVVDRVLDAQGKTIYQAKPKEACEECIANGSSPPNVPGKIYAPQAISSEIAFLMTAGLKNVVAHGTGIGAAALKRADLAGKTGTTNDQMDAWFSGYNSDLVATAWVGFDKNTSLREYGARAALPMWVDFMRVALAGRPEHTMPEPPGIVTAVIDPATGLLAESGQENGYAEFFEASTVPTETAGSGAPKILDGFNESAPDDATQGDINQEEPLIDEPEF
jgi:penicillin-binding protein 1A